MAGNRGQQRVRQQKVFYQCEPEGSSNCVCLDRKFIATQELLPVEEVERLASSVLAGSCETTPLTMIVYPDRLALQVRKQGTQLPEIFYDDIIQFEAVPNMADTFFLLSGRKSSVGISQSHSKNRRRPVVSPIIRAPMREQRDPIYASMPTSSLSRQRNAGNHVHQHYDYPTSAITVVNNSLQNERQPKVKFNLYPPKPVHYTPPESPTGWSDEETPYSESDEDYDDGTASLISSPRVTNRVRVAQLSSSPSPSRIQPPPPSAHPIGSRCDVHSSRNINLLAQHVRDEESVQSDDSRSFDSLYSEDASSTPYPTHGATYVNELSQRLQQRRLI
ncbi:hypothetical protein AAHC03_01632 [Spirometra sp. Aus1]